MSDADYKARSYQVGEQAFVLVVTGASQMVSKCTVVSVDYEHERPHYMVKVHNPSRATITNQSICVFEKRNFGPDGVLPEGDEYITYLIPTEDDPVTDRVSEQLARKRVQFWAKDIQDEMTQMNVKMDKMFKSVSELRNALGWLDKTMRTR